MFELSELSTHGTGGKLVYNVIEFPPEARTALCGRLKETNINGMPFLDDPPEMIVDDGTPLRLYVGHGIKMMFHWTGDETFCWEASRDLLRVWKE